MFKICPKCNHAYQADDTITSTSCPACGVIYAKYDAATAKSANDTLNMRARRIAPARPNRFLIKIILFAALIGGASVLYRMQHPINKNTPTGSTTLPLLANVNSKSDQIEFTDLFDSGASFSSLAVHGQYTVIEVYLDQCSYCRELEKAIIPLRAKRGDIGFIRVHHPGAMHNNVQGSSREDLEAKINALNLRMASYQLCGSPHVELYGPDKEAIAVDTCKTRLGTTFLWDWITTETGVTRSSPAGMFTKM